MEVLNDNRKPWGLEIDQYCALMHFAQFAGYLVPLAGMILPVLMWITNKELDPKIDKNGKNIVNWIISSFIYLLFGGILSILLIGIPILIVVGLFVIIFPIIGGVKAMNGEVYNYPLSIEFLK